MTHALPSALHAHSRLPLIAFLGLAAAILGVTMTTPTREFGDGREYVVQTQSLVFDGTRAIDPARRAEYFNRTNPFGVNLTPRPPEALSTPRPLTESAQYGGGFGALYQGSDGSCHYVHAWVYSAVVAPVYLLLHQFAPAGTEYSAFAVVNLLLLSIPVLLMWRARPGWSTVAFLGAAAASPITPHLQWAHPEIFCLSITLWAFAVAGSRRWWPCAPLLLGTAAAQNIPLLLFLPLLLRAQIAHLIAQLRTPRWRPSAVLLGTLALSSLGGALLASIPALLTYHHFGSWNLIVALKQAALENLTISRLTSIVASPILGFLWYFPAAWLALLWGVTSAPRIGVAALTAASVLAVAALSSTTSNINSAQLSACRYAVWYLAPLYWLPFETAADTRGHTRGHTLRSLFSLARVCILTFGIAVATSSTLWLGSWRMALGRSAQFFSLNRATPEVAALYRATHFEDDPECIAENILQHELGTPYQFDGIYIWNLGAQRSLWLISKRAFLRRQKVSVTIRQQHSGGTPGSLQKLSELFQISGQHAPQFVLKPTRWSGFTQHPVLGGYHFVWVDAGIEQATSFVPLVVR